ncbi:integrase arm-type DNA-binding domain-containing protein [Burkholderia guangdongensis]|uniref:integrase arm-type DNA-binding domain-containing protein n=1 Tax=Burkholderia guangdongensis TaxID=1792500 RepID=UPI001FE3EFB2|nr:integrase arm-type DNA-binding domain-containing protein [Burkholderia guangdongensis]
MSIDGCPGLRLKATQTRWAWVYRFKSPVDERMRQIKIGEWPALSLAAAVVAWEHLKDDRKSGNDPVLARRLSKSTVGDMVQQAHSPTLRQVCRGYLEGHVERHRKAKNRGNLRPLGRRNFWGSS